MSTITKRKWCSAKQTPHKVAKWRRNQIWRQSCYVTALWYNRKNKTPKKISRKHHQSAWAPYCVGGRGDDEEDWGWGKLVDSRIGAGPQRKGVVGEEVRWQMAIKAEGMGSCVACRLRGCWWALPSTRVVRKSATKQKSLSLPGLETTTIQCKDYSEPRIL